LTKIGEAFDRKKGGKRGSRNGAKWGRRAKKNLQVFPGGGGVGLKVLYSRLLPINEKRIGVGVERSTVLGRSVKTGIER